LSALSSKAFCRLGIFLDLIAGLPDGIFSSQKSQFGPILKGLTTEDVGMHILLPFGTFSVHYIGIFLL
jgi:hypothetical protein